MSHQQSPDLSYGQLLTTGTDQDQLLPKLVHAINRATEIEITVSFVQPSGLKLLFEPLAEALARGTTLKLITSDYLCITHPIALRELMLLVEHSANIRIFSCKPKQSFHMKSYIFIKGNNGNIEQGCAFIGSNNISNSALTDALEWSLRYDYQADADQDLEFTHIRQQFSKLFLHQQSQPLSHDWIDAYVKRYQQRPKLTVVTDDIFNPIEALEPATPNAAQQEALTALNDSRAQGHKRGLVVLAMGMGKTYLAAFDVLQLQAKRVLFVAHREEILQQAQRTFLQILPNATTGYYQGGNKSTDTDLLFASIQTLGKQPHLNRFAPDHFDYLIIDEFHHATAPGYQMQSQTANHKI